MSSDGQISVTVRTRKGVEHRARGGHSFTKVPSTVLVTAENLQLIKDDPRLNIIADAPSKPEAAEAITSADAKAKAKTKK